MRDRAALSRSAPAVAPPVPQRALERGFGLSSPTDTAVAEGRESPVAGQFDHSFEDIDVVPPVRLTEPGDADEEAADRTADQVMAPRAPLQTGIEPREPSSASRRPRPDAGATLEVPERPGSRGRGVALEPAQRDELEPIVGQSLADVRIHTDEAADADSRALGARAFTRGRDVHFQRGLFQPHTPAGRWLLTHELTHAIRTRTNVVARDGVVREQTGSATTTTMQPATPADIRDFVELTIDFIRRGKEYYDPMVSGIAPKSRTPVLQAPPVSRGQLVRQLDGWRAATTQSLTLIQTSLNNDAVLDQRIHQAYRSAVESVVVAAATHQQKSRHELFDEHRDRILDWAWPVAVADPNRDALSNALPAAGRGQIRVVTTAVALGNVDAFFPPRAGMSKLPVNTAVRFSPSIGRQLRDGLQNIAVGIAGIPDELEVNTTLTLALDLGRVGGDYAAYRFTRVRHAPQGQGQPASDEILIEHLGTIGLDRPRPGDVQTQRERFTRLGLKLGGGWTNPDFETNAELQAVLRGIDGIPDATFARIPGLTIDRARVSAIDPTHAGEYDGSTHTVTLFDLAFPTSATRFGTPGAGLSDVTSNDIRHEIGHAVDEVSLRTAFATWKSSAERLNALVDRQRAQFRDVEVSPNRYNIPAARKPAWDALKRRIDAAKTTEVTDAAARDAARGLSGSRWQLRPNSNVFETAEDAAVTGANAFRQAALQDGVRITKYSDKSWLEYFAESYALFVSAPDDLQRLRPNVFAFMRANFP